MIGKLGLMAAGGALWKGTSALVGGAVGLGVNPFLGAAVGKGMMGMKLPGGMGAGMQKATGITRTTKGYVAREVSITTTGS